MTGFGDDDPEDAFDADDPPVIRLGVLRRVVPSILAEEASERRELRRAWARRVLDRLTDPSVDPSEVDRLRRQLEDR